MEVIKLINGIIAFPLELFMLFYLGYWSYHNNNNIFLKCLFTIGFPLSTAILWGIFAAPKSKTRLDNPYRMLVKLALFLSTAFLIYQSGQVHLALAFAMIALLNEIAALFLN